MTEIQFFTDTDIASLQDQINEWLCRHKAIRVINSNISSLVMPDLLGEMQGKEKHVFFILYSTSAKTDSSHKQMTAVNIIAETDEQNLSTQQ
ncbi:MAG TPA: hypothetical protein VL093_08750 [Flavipsychrobacter sp.]|jgi:hypothetical protein|nr:hypothetical protein [Flavipsychrobacter sp.]